MASRADDPRDVGDSGLKAWHEFQASFAASFLSLWLLEDTRSQEIDYLKDLRRRLGEAVVTGHMWGQEPPEWMEEWDGTVPLQGPDEDGGVNFIPLEEAELLEAQLFPSGFEGDEFWWHARGLSVIGLHSALESYCRALGIDLQRKSLVKAVSRHMAARSTKHLPAPLVDTLRECDATRHLFVHNRGIVDEQYMNAVPDNHLIPGERKPLEHSDVLRFARGIWETAVILRHIS